MNDSLLERRLPVLILIATVTLVSFFNWSMGFGDWMMVPDDVVTAWHSLKTGETSGNVLQELFTTVSAAFLHADGRHLMGNMLFLWIFGVVVQELCGWKWLFGVFLITAAGGSVGQILLNTESAIPTLGASGAVMGIEGFYFGLATLSPRPDAKVWPIARPVSSTELATAAIIGVVLDFMGVIGPNMSIAYGAHIGGFITGIVISLIADRFIR
ncbi:MAG: rhomboid family intramembrane serine protease [Akkermansiaceae bacterium]|jgi:membrane associated rhomboid family serine protease